MSKVVYRLRPFSENTLDEIINSYLWFSKPIGFKDDQDSNIKAYFDNCDILRKEFKTRFGRIFIEDMFMKMRHIGICCFTSKRPTYNQRKNFPNGNNSICVEYDKVLLETFFLNNEYALANCFMSVEYFKNPTIFVKDGEYHIITKEDKNGYLSESIKSICYNEKALDRFMWTLFTRIDKKFKRQKESRIILAGRNITQFDDSICGYRVDIPSEAIKNIYIYENTPIDFVDKLNKYNLKHKLLK